jgi:hypothetical protein
VLRLLLRGEFAISGLTARALRTLLPEKTRGQISRLLKRLRVHGLIKKIGRHYKYYLTNLGREVATHDPQTARTLRDSGTCLLTAKSLLFLIQLDWKGTKLAVSIGCTALDADERRLKPKHTKISGRGGAPPPPTTPPRSESRNQKSKIVEITGRTENPHSCSEGQVRRRCDTPRGRSHCCGSTTRRAAHAIAQK